MVPQALKSTLPKGLSIILASLQSTLIKSWNGSPGKVKIKEKSGIFPHLQFIQNTLNKDDMF